MIASYGTGIALAAFAAVNSGKLELLFVVLAIAFVLGALYLAVAVQNYIGAGFCLLCAIIVAIFFT